MRTRLEAIRVTRDAFSSEKEEDGTTGQGPQWSRVMNLFIIE